VVPYRQCLVTPYQCIAERVGLAATVWGIAAEQGFNPLQSIALQTLDFGRPADQVLGTAPFTLIATSSSGQPVTLVSNTTAVCTVSGATVTLVSAGACTIQATQAGGIGYAAATPVTQSFQVLQWSPCDINQDGTENVVDVQAIVNEALGITPAVHDLNGDGMVNVAEVQMVVDAALGLGCNAQ
jgi:hypothetical protein